MLSLPRVGKAFCRQWRLEGGFGAPKSLPCLFLHEPVKHYQVSPIRSGAMFSAYVIRQFPGGGSEVVIKKP